MYMDPESLWLKGYMVIARNPWRKRQMKAILEEVNPAKAITEPEYIGRHLPPWAKKLGWIYAGSPYQLKVWETFGELNSKYAEEYKNLPKYERLKKRLLAVKSEMENKTFGRKERKKAPGLAVIKKLIGSASKPVPPRPSTPTPVVVRV